MVKRIGRRFVSLLLTFVTTLTLLPAMTLPALAANGNVTGLTDSNIGLSFNGDTPVSWTATGTQIVGSATGTSGTCSDTHYQSTLTITNKKATNATLSFDYAIEESSGTIKVDGTKVTANSTFSRELASNDTVTVYIKSGSTSAATKITITKIKLVSAATATVTFQPPPAENGSYTVNGNTITETWTNNQSSTIPYRVKATPAGGYQFMGWYDVTHGKYISTAAETELNIESDCIITARFASKTAALFETGGQIFDDLNEANAEAQKKLPATIALVSDGSIAGNYTISSGVTLLIPFDDARTDYTTMPRSTGLVAAKKNQSVYTTLTMDEGSQITVYGNISLPAQVSSANSSYTGVISGPCGTIHMKPSSRIVLKNGSNLYCWGFITGTGDIKAEPGATVYEEFQICDYRGGSKTSKLNDEGKVFPFAQYYVQNIEATLEIEYGAKEITVCRLHSTSYTKADVSLNFITKDSGGLFNLQPESSFVKKYDSATERVTYEVIGDATLSSITIDAGATVKSQNFNLPIMQNTTINVKSGTTTIDQSLCLIPGSQVIIDEGATVNIAAGKSIYVYDRSDWVYKEWDTETIVVKGQKKPRYVYSGFTFSGSTDFKPEYYTPSRSDGWTPIFKTADMKDVKFDINGTLNVDGNLYTTKGGADITSSLGGGKIVLSTAPTGDVITHQYMQSRKEYKSSSGKYETDAPGYKEISATPARLHNANGSYTETSAAKAGKTFTYCTCEECNGKWEQNVAVICNSNGAQTEPYHSLQDAIEAYTPDDSTSPKNYIKMLHNTTENITTTTKDIYLDLNGYTVTGNFNMGEKTLYGMDSSVKGYDALPKGKIVGSVVPYAKTTYQTPTVNEEYDRYVAILGQEGTTQTLSFHRFNISVTGYRFELAAPQCALIFIGKFQGDDVAKDYLTSLGFTLTDKIDGKTENFSCAKSEFFSDGAQGENSTVDISEDGAYLFEAYLMRDIDKGNPATYQTPFTATAQATFGTNRGTQNSETKQLSFKDAWQKAENLTDEQKAILNDKFPGEPSINQQTE